MAQGCCPGQAGQAVQGATETLVDAVSYCSSDPANWLYKQHKTCTCTHQGEVPGKLAINAEHCSHCLFSSDSHTHVMLMCCCTRRTQWRLLHRVQTQRLQKSCYIILWTTMNGNALLRLCTHAMTSSSQMWQWR